MEMVHSEEPQGCETQGPFRAYQKWFDKSDETYHYTVLVLAIAQSRRCKQCYLFDRISGSTCDAAELIHSVLDMYERRDLRKNKN